MIETIKLPVDHHFNKQPILDAMKVQRITAQQLAVEKGCTNVTISRVLNGHTNSHELLVWICERLGIALESVAVPVTLQK